MSKPPPHNNRPALTGYRLALFSIIPVTGIVTGLLAIGWGVMGLQWADAHDREGKGHALQAMFIGLLLMLIQTAAILFPLLLRD